MRPVLAGTRLHLHICRIRSGFLFSERECTELLARHQFWQPFLLLLVRAEQKQRANPDRVMRVNENRCRCATAADFLQHLAVRHLRKAASAIFLRRGHAEHADASQAVDHAARNIRLSIDLRRIEMFIEKLREARASV